MISPCFSFHSQTRLIELFASELMASFLFLGEFPLDDHLGRDARVIGSRKPEGVVPGHAFPASQRVLDGAKKGVAIVKSARDVWRRHGNGERRLRTLVLRAKIALRLPFGVKLVFKITGIVGLVHGRIALTGVKRAKY